MTDPTPAKGATPEAETELDQLIERYRMLIDHSRNMHWRSSAGHYEVLLRVLKDARAGAKQLDLAEQTIRDAPHGPKCSGWAPGHYLGAFAPQLCDCWKARYTAAKEELK